MRRYMVHVAAITWTGRVAQERGARTMLQRVVLSRPAEDMTESKPREYPWIGLRSFHSHAFEPFRPWRLY